MSPHDPEALSRLRGFLEVTRVVRSEEELGELLASIAKSISESLGFATVVVHLYRPAWDDFEVTTVHGSPEAVARLEGLFCAVLLNKTEHAVQDEDRRDRDRLGNLAFDRRDGHRAE